MQYRKSLEESALLCLQTLLAKQVSLELEWQQAGQQGLLLRNVLQAGLHAGPVPAAELHFCNARMEGVVAHQRRIEKALQELMTAITAQSELHRRCRQEREILESLRHRQMEEHQLQQRRREQLLLDDLYLMRPKAQSA